MAPATRPSRWWMLSLLAALALPAAWYSQSGGQDILEEDQDILEEESFGCCLAGWLYECPNEITVNECFVGNPSGCDRDESGDDSCKDVDGGAGQDAGEPPFACCVGRSYFECPDVSSRSECTSIGNSSGCDRDEDRDDSCERDGGEGE